MVAELRHADLVLSSIIVNRSIETDNVADAFRELIEALRHLQGVSDQSAAEIRRALAPAQRARPLKVQVPVLDVLLANLAHGFGDVEPQALSAIRWQVRLLADEARLADEFLPLASLASDPDSHGRALATLDGTRESYRRRTIVAVQMIRDTLSLLRVRPGGALSPLVLPAHQAKPKRCRISSRY